MFKGFTTETKSAVNEAPSGDYLKVNEDLTGRLLVVRVTGHTSMDSKFGPDRVPVAVCDVIVCDGGTNDKVTKLPMYLPDLWFVGKGYERQLAQVGAQVVGRPAEGRNTKGFRFSYLAEVGQADLDTAARAIPIVMAELNAPAPAPAPF